MEGANFDSLNEDCLVHILSFTSPGDVCRARAVSPSLRSAAESDTIWEKFLPPDWGDMLPRSGPSLQFSSMKELYFLLCQPRLVDNGRRSLWLDKSSGKKSYMLPAKDLKIWWRDDRRNWQLSAYYDSNDFYAELNDVSWIDVCGTINMASLSPNTTYTVRFLVRYSPNSFGRYHSTMKLSIKVNRDPHVRKMTMLVFPNQVGNVLRPSKEHDGCMQVRVGEFFCDGDEGEVEFGMKEVDEFCEGIIIVGAEIRPSSKGREESSTNRSRAL